MARRKAKHPSGRENAGQDKSRQKSSSRAPVLKKRRGANWPLLALAVAGMALTGYLTLSSWQGTQPLYCEEGSSCDIVQASRWGSFLGLPTAFWGFVAYAALGYTAYRVRNPARHFQLSWIIALAGLGISVYLTVISVSVIQAACVYCLAHLGLMAATVVVVTLQRPAGLPGFAWPTWAGQTGAVVVALVVGLHLHYSGLFDPAVGPEDPYLKALATHLSERDAIFYGAFW